MPTTEIFTQEDFNAKLKDYKIIGSSQYSVDFKEFIFHIDIDIHINANYINLKNCIFKGKVLMPYSIHSKALFDDSTFEKEVIFKDTNFEGSASFENTTFNDEVDFENAKFENKARFYSTRFNGETNFYNTKFNDLADFWNAQFYKKTIFNKTDFLGTTVFSSTTFKENVLFSYSLISKLAIFRGTNFEKGLDLSLALISGNMTFFDINIEDFEAVNDTKNPETFSDYVTEKGIITRKNKRETFRIIKNRLIQNQNSIDALNFAKLEMNAYRHELKQKVFKEKKKNEIQNLILLYINGISNKHNTSWLRGIGFTLGVALIFSFASIIATDNYKFGIQYINIEDFTTCIKYFFTALLPTHSINYMEIEKPKMFFYLWDFLGRIFISYGIYQTIQAFRKYKIK